MLTTLAAVLLSVQDGQALIDALEGVKAEGLGYSSSRTGVEFLPLAGTASSATMLLGQDEPRPSPLLRQIVEKGVSIVPLLLKSLEDARPTKLPPVRGLMWTRFGDEYDVNERAGGTSPKGVRRDGFGEGGPHTLTVGDLCFVALGQVVNRSFNAARYQPSGGMVVNSPSRSKALREAARAEWGGLTREKHLDGLLRDLAMPDHEVRAVGAYYRLAFYYPEAVEEPVLKVLAGATYDVFKVQPLLRDILYVTPDAAKRKETFEAFVKEHGPAGKEGVLMYLFDDLDTQEAVEEKRMSGTDHVKDRPRALLIELFGLPKTVKAKDRPYPTFSEGCVRARFIQALVHDTSRKIDEVAHDILKGAGDNDYLAIACMTRLRGRGYDDTLRAYIDRRVGKEKHYTDQLRALRPR